MLARSRPLHLASAALTSPLLVPSVSSKGFPLDDEGIAESGAALDFLGQDLTESLLVSAYDLHHGHLPEADRALSDDHHHQTFYAKPQLLVVDSGGYELNRADFESGETQRGPYEPRPFESEDFDGILARLPHGRDLLVVSFDSPGPRGTYKEQRETAQRQLSARPDAKTAFLIKPEGQAPFLHVPSLAADAVNMRAFDVIGVTEKELGDSVLDRLVALVGLRRLLDDQGCADKPVHVFGSLDPLMTSLYFMAGAEIFDGLSWLRYAYSTGLSVHPESLGILRAELEDRKQRRDAFRHVLNLRELQSLKHRLVRWAQEPDRYELLGKQSETLREAYEIMTATLKREG